MTSLVFKFRDDLSITTDPTWRDLFNLPDEYIREATTFFQNARKAHPSVTYNQPGPGDSLKRQANALDKRLRDLVNASPGVQLRYLFDYKDCKTINLLWRKLDSYEKGKSGSPNGQPSDMPNLFNYFRIDFPKDYGQEEAAELLDQFGRFLPYKANKSSWWLRYRLFRWLNGLAHQVTAKNSLLQYAYLKDDPVPLATSFPTPAQAQQPGMGNQYYLTDMRIPGNFVPDPAAPIRMTVVEVDSWSINHTQLPGLTRSAVIFPTDIRTQILNIPAATDKLSHGTQILGILSADSTNSDNAAGTDLCRGIAPNVSVRLASCITALNRTGDTINSISYEEERAVLAAVSATEPGETILFELATGGGRFPLDVLPAVYELIDIAYRRDITVVAGAGNDSAILDTGDNRYYDNYCSLLDDVRDDHPASHYSAYDLIHEHIAQLAQEHNISGHAHPQFPSTEEFIQHYQQTPSRAILVGAALRTDGGNTFTVLPTSSRGNRVKVFAQGHNILTTNPGNRFFSAMGSTSGSAAIIAGMVVLAQSIAKTRNRVIPPALLFTWLKQSSRGGHRVMGLPSGSSGVVPSWRNVEYRLNQWLGPAGD
ncbi:S8 family serine peptidase [Spirosoma areae]